MEWNTNNLTSVIQMKKLISLQPSYLRRLQILMPFFESDLIDTICVNERRNESIKTFTS